MLLEHYRLAGAGTIQKRKADSKAEQLEIMMEKADATASEYIADGIPIDTAINAAQRALHGAGPRRTVPSCKRGKKTKAGRGEKSPKA